MDRVKAGAELCLRSHRRSELAPATSRRRLLLTCDSPTVYAIRWDEKAGLRRDAIGSQVIDALEAQEIKEIGNEEG
jgi:hypothetical protein